MYRRTQIIETLKLVYNIQTGRALIQYAVPALTLKDFTTSKTESKKGIFRIPDKIYLIHETKHIHKEITDAIIPEYQDEEKSVTLNGFKILKELGTTDVSTTYLVKKINGPKLYVMKKLKLSIILNNEISIKSVIEKSLLKKSQYPFLLGLEYAFQSDNNIYFVMKFYKGGELYNYLLKTNRFTESLAKFYAAQIALGLGRLHEKEIIYKDLKPENIFIDENGYIAIADFGLSKILDETQFKSSYYGTAEYIPPEIIDSSSYNKQVDWWEFGILIYEMIIGVPPFRCRNSLMLYELIKQNEVNWYGTSAKVGRKKERKGKRTSTEAGKRKEKNEIKRKRQSQGRLVSRTHPYALSNLRVVFLFFLVSLFKEVPLFEHTDLKHPKALFNSY